MSHRRIGELLSRIVPLSDQDVEEILHEQAVTRRRFGEIALAWGLCEPGHVWRAWAEQNRESLPCVDLRRLGVDAQATAYMPGETARALGAIPFRCFEQLVVVAVKDEQSRAHAEATFKPDGMQVSFVRADADAIESAIDALYPTTIAAEKMAG
jgi:hypothetical protein